MNRLRRILDTASQKGGYWKLKFWMYQTLILDVPNKMEVGTTNVLEVGDYVQTTGGVYYKQTKGGSWSSLTSRVSLSGVVEFVTPELISFREGYSDVLVTVSKKNVKKLPPYDPDRPEVYFLRAVLCWQSTV